MSTTMTEQYRSLCDQMAARVHEIDAAIKAMTAERLELVSLLLEDPAVAKRGRPRGSRSRPKVVEAPGSYAPAPDAEAITAEVS
jgi:hypothetical protein